MAERRSPVVLLLSSRSTLADLGERLGRRGVRLVRIETVIPIVKPYAGLARRLETFGAYDAVVVTSKSAIAPFVRLLMQDSRTNVASTEFWAVGDETALALARAGVRRVRRGNGEGAGPLRRALRGRALRVVLPRSARAGPELARWLEQDGHMVLDLIAYTIRPGKKLNTRALRRARAAVVVVATSPSAISHFRRMVDARTFRHLAGSARWVVLGPRTAAAARGHGLGRVGVAPSASVQRFTPYLLGVLAHATN